MIVIMTAFLTAAITVLTYSILARPTQMGTGLEMPVMMIMELPLR